MKQIKFLGRTDNLHPIYAEHPFYKGYAMTLDHEIFNINTKERIEVTEYADNHFIKINDEIYPLDRFKWECCYGIIQKNEFLIHIDGKYRNNELYNLKLITCENFKKV